jgi:glutamate racemase
MVSKPLLFYDSGAGGLPYLAAARARLPAERYIYLADRENFPLGEKPAELVRQVVLEAVSLAVERFDPRLAVIACNTASVVALQALREHFSIPFVGVVPAVKPAALSLERGKLAVVSTRQTASGPYLERLIQEFADGREVIKVPVADLVEFAEYRFLSTDPGERLAAVRKALSPLLRREVQAVVLGCTHFLLLEREFRTVLTDRVTLIDSREGVTRRIVTLLAGGSGTRGPGDRLSGSSGPGGHAGPLPARTSRDAEEGPLPGQRAELYLHGGAWEQERYRAFARHFDLRYRGLLEEASR